MIFIEWQIETQNVEKLVHKSVNWELFIKLQII